MTDIFGVQVLSEKLTNLNNSQQSIESLSRWCIIHRKKAKQVVETWEKMYNTFPKEKRIPMMYLANDILQNSRRKGSEFVNEFWKVLPRALKSIYESGDDREKNVVMRLVNIWEERKVFGSRGQVLKDEMLGKESKDPPPSVECSSKSYQSIKVVKKDAHSIRFKLAVGCMPERIVSAFRLVQDEQLNEEDILNKCKEVVDKLGALEKDVDVASAQGRPQPSVLISEYFEHETLLNECIQGLENFEATRAALVSSLKEALLQQESMWGDIRLQLQVAKAEAAHMSSLKQKLTSAPVVSSSITQVISGETLAAAGGTTNSVGNAAVQPTAFVTRPTQAFPVPSKAVGDYNPPNHSGASVMLPLTQTTTFANSTSSTEDHNKKTAAAAVAAKLAAMTSSAQVLTSVLSSLVAEEAASMNGNVKHGSFPSSSPIFTPEKRPKLERPMQISDSNNMHSLQVSHQSSSMLQVPSQVPTPALPPAPPINPPQPPFPPLPPPLPSLLPQMSPYNTQSSGGVTGGASFVFGGNSPSLPPPPPSHVILGLARSAPMSMGTPIQQPPLQQPQSLQQPHMPPPAQPAPPPPQLPQSTISGFFPPSGMGFYGQPPSASTGQAPQR